MKRIAILALEKAHMASIADARQIFRMVNVFLQQGGHTALFEVRVVGLRDEVELEDGLYRIRTEQRIAPQDDFDLIIIPSLSGDMISSTFVNIEYASWLASQYKRGTEIASLCTGAFLLALSGLLKKRQCTTHWLYANEFKHVNPAVELVDERVITDQGGLYTSGGNNAYWNLLLYLVEKYAGREMAIYAAKYFVIDINRNIQSPFIVFHGQKDHNDKHILEVQEYIEQNYRTQLSVQSLSQNFHMTRRTLERRFKKATRNSVAEYIRKVKIEAAKKQLESGRKNIHDIMLDLGYTDLQAFRELFKRVAGMTPVEYRMKYEVVDGRG